jgi:hypothetical protein
VSSIRERGRVVRACGVGSGEVEGEKMRDQDRREVQKETEERTKVRRKGEIRTEFRSAGDLWRRGRGRLKKSSENSL